jgi:cell division protein FtsI (penicillin-binding protein 3)
MGGGSRFSRPRTIGLFFVLAACLTLLWARLYVLQVRQHHGLAERAARQFQKHQPLTTKRGAILDRRGRELAVSVTVASAFAQPALVGDPPGAAAKLAPILGLPAAELQKKLTGQRSFTWLRRKLDPPAAQAVAALNLPGIHLIPESRRYYPKGPLAAHVLGFVGMDDQGLEGVELQYDALLGGGQRWVVSQQDALGRPIFRAEVEARRPIHDLTLTIDEAIQYVTERELQRAMERTRALAGAVVVLDPRSGEILALANAPSFDPNRPDRFPPAARRNRAVADYYEPGSVFKVIMAAAALEEGVIRPHDRVYGENGAITVAGVRIRDHDKYGWLTFEDVIAQSSNVGAIKVGLRLGKTLYYDHISGFGFGSPTAIDLPGETPGLIRKPKGWSALSAATLSIGQEISVTPVQLLTAVAAIGNGGQLVRPHVALRVRRADGGAARELTPPPVRRVISPEVARDLTGLMVAVVREGTGKRAAVEGHAVAGKTGTSQKRDPASGRYSHTKFVASFVGFAPAQDPRVAILIALDEPRGAYYGGAVAAPVFREIAREVLQYLGVPPAEPAPPVQVARKA